MSVPPDHLRFLHRIRRRWAVWRTLEYAGACAAIGAGIGLPIVLALMWRGENAIQPAVILLLIGAVAGAILGISRPPTLLQTALMADRQLGLHDLLSTATSSQRWGDPEFHAVVLAEAQRVCRSCSTNELILRRLGGRAWGGIGIASALVLTVAAMSGRPLVSSAGVETVESRREGDSANNPIKADGIAQVASPSPHHETASERRPDAEDSDQSGDPSAGRGGNWSNRATRVTSSGDGTGSSMGRTNDRVGAPLPQLRAGNGPAVGDGTLAAGGGRALANGSQGDALGSTASANPASPAIPAWQGEGWHDDQAAATQRLESGQIPDSYRDMVREYFQIDRP